MPIALPAVSILARNPRASIWRQSSATAGRSWSDRLGISTSCLSRATSSSLGETALASAASSGADDDVTSDSLPAVPCSLIRDQSCCSACGLQSQRRPAAARPPGRLPGHGRASDRHRLPEIRYGPHVPHDGSLRVHRNRRRHQIRAQGASRLLSQTPRPRRGPDAMRQPRAPLPTPSMTMTVATESVSRGTGLNQTERPFGAAEDRAMLEHRFRGVPVQKRDGSAISGRAARAWPAGPSPLPPAVRRPPTCRAPSTAAADRAAAERGRDVEPVSRGRDARRRGPARPARGRSQVPRARSAGSGCRSTTSCGTGNALPSGATGSGPTGSGSSAGGKSAETMPASASAAMSAFSSTRAARTEHAYRCHRRSFSRRLTTSDACTPAATRPSPRLLPAPDRPRPG